MSPDAPLHPRRIQAALSFWDGTHPAEDVEADVIETCVAALRLLQKSQHAAGLSSDVVDVGARGLELIKALIRIR